MAEKIVSPGVFTQERDLSFLPQGISEIGAAIIGPTKKGPAFIPTLCESFQDFEDKFGGHDLNTYVPLTVSNYLESAGRVTIVRVLGIGGYIVTNPVIIKAKDTDGDLRVAAVLAPAKGYYQSSLSNTRIPAGIGIPASVTVALTGVPAATGTLTIAFASFRSGASQVITFTESASAGEVAFGTDDVAVLNIEEATDTATIVGDALAVLCASVSGYNAHYSDTSGNDSAGTLTITADVAVATTHNITISESADSLTVGTPVVGVTATEAGLPDDTGTFVLEISGSSISATRYSASLDPSSDYYISKVFGEDPLGDKEVYVHSHWEDAWSGTANVVGGDFDIAVSGDELNFDSKDSVWATTPYVISQTMGSENKNLFRLHTLSHGDSANRSFKVGISTIKAAGKIAGSDYGSFTVIIRKVKPYYGALDTDRQPEILETFEGCTLDPNNAKYVARVIGDQYQTIDSAGKVYTNGDYAARSKYIRVEASAAVKNGTMTPSAVPFGHAAYKTALGDTIEDDVRAVSNVISQDLDDTFNSKVFHGFDFTVKDNYKNYLRALPSGSGSGGNEPFLLSALSGHPSSSYTGTLGLTDSTPLTHRKFIIAFQGGFDGMNPATPRNMESDIGSGNTQGFDLTNSQSSGSVAYKKAINAVSNPDAFDINMIATPGLLYNLHPGTITHAKNVCEDRGDAFYIFDPTGLSASVTSTTGAIEDVDTNYAATYYPWVKVNDVSANKHRWVPPSVVLPGVLAFNDSVAYEWYAPAGLNRGGLSQVLQAYTNLTHSERDDLYDGRVNPIASFPGQGVVVWGQKTLQGLPSALDRINVRRLLIALKKFIASATKYLVFEQNSIATRNRFLGIVNPYLETVQSRQGLSAFKVVMDDSNNTPDIIDRNILFGQIFLQPTRTAEFIVLDFNIMPTGAAFPE